MSNKSEYENTDFRIGLDTFFDILERSSEELYRLELSFRSENGSVNADENEKEKKVKEKKEEEDYKTIRNNYLEYIAKEITGRDDVPPDTIRKVISEFAKMRIWDFNPMNGSINPYPKRLNRLTKKDVSKKKLDTLLNRQSIFKLGEDQREDEPHLFYEPYQRIIDNNNYLKTQAKKSAIAAVMSRNMSHNYGSHSLVYLGNKDNLVNYVHDERKQISVSSTLKQFIEIDTSKKLPELLAIYNNNLRMRMDLVADIVTSVPVSENTRWLFKDVLTRFTDNRILADTISGSNNFTYEFTSDEGDIPVSIPNDVLGMNAFSIIIENIIRNCAKHGGKEDVKLTIHIQDGNEIGLSEYYKISIHQDCTRAETDCSDCEIIIRNRRLDINTPILDDNQRLRSGAWGILEMKIAAAYLRKIPPEDIDNIEYKLEILEGKDDAKSSRGEWKNGSRNSQHDNPGTPYILTSNCCEETGCTSSRGLGYSFFLMKPKEVLIFDYDNKINLEGNNEIVLLNSGIKIIHGQSTIEDLIRTNIFNHKILLCFSDDLNKTDRENLIKKCKINMDGKEITVDYSTNLPNRIIWLNPDNLESNNNEYRGNNECLIHCLETGQTDCFIKKCWEIWTDVLIDKLKKREKCDYFILNGYNFPDYKSTGNKAFKAIIPGKPHELNFKKKAKDNCYVDFDSNFSVSKLPFEGINGIIKRLETPDPYDSSINIENKFCFEMVSLFESFVNRVGVIDERIQDFAYNSKYTIFEEHNQIWYYQYFKKMNIHIPYKNNNDTTDKEPGINLSNADYSGSLKINILKWIEIKCPKLDFLFIHMGIIEKLCGNTDPDDIRDYFNEKIINKSGECKIIIISGRGKPHNIPPYTRFLNYSQVAAYLCDNQSKYILHDLCNSSRKLK